MNQVAQLSALAVRPRWAAVDDLVAIVVQPEDIEELCAGVHVPWLTSLMNCSSSGPGWPQQVRGSASNGHAGRLPAA